jgi:hypothetical protein
MTPHDALPPDPAGATAQEAESPAFAWRHKLTAVVFITFCLEIGLYLVIVPWTESWSLNYFSDVVPALRDVWNSLAIRGAVGLLGAVNIYIALSEVLRLRYFARR